MNLRRCTNYGPDSELASLRARVLELEQEIDSFNRLESLIIELAPEQCRQNSLGAENILRRFSEEYRKLAHQNHLVRHGHIKPEDI